jgi:hypothetical protein
MLSLILTLSNASFIGCMPFRDSSGAKEDRDRTFWAEAKGLTPAVTRDNIRQTIEYIETKWTGLEVTAQYSTTQYSTVREGKGMC